MLGKQAAAAKLASGLAPQNRIGLWLPNLTIRAMAIPGVAELAMSSTPRRVEARELPGQRRRMASYREPINPAPAIGWYRAFDPAVTELSLHRRFRSGLI